MSVFCSKKWKKRVANDPCRLGAPTSITHDTVVVFTRRSGSFCPTS